jgi:hypothetical protein
MKDKKLRILVLLSLILLFFTFFYSYLSVPLWDYDFWWHISTGRYISENGHLPEKDPFSYTSDLAENKNLLPRYETLILKNYWLCQIFFYEIYKTFGAMGMIILRSLILMLVVLFVYWGLRRDSVKFYIIFPFVFLTWYTTMSFTGERPVLFTLLFSVLSFLLLDSFKKTRARTIFFLIPLMLLWANLHAGFIIGDIIIAAFITGETLDIMLKRTAYTKNELFVFYSVTMSSIAVSGINPNGFSALIVSLSPGFRIMTAGSQEYQSVFPLYWSKIRSMDIGYIILLALSPLILILRARKMNLSHIILLSGFLLMSIVSLRFIAYFVAIGTLIVGREINHVIGKLFEKGTSKKAQTLLTGIFAVIILLSTVVYAVGVVKFEKFRFKKAIWYSVPKGAVDFIEKNRLSGNIFNDFGFGGYLTWRLYPWKKTFVDTRTLNYTIDKEYEWILKTVESIKSKELPEGKTPLWKRLLDHYNVNIILLDTLGVQGGVPPLLLKLMEDDTWVPVYVDLISIVFVRNTEDNQDIIKIFRVPKEMVYNAVTVRAIEWAMMTGNPAYLTALGDIFFKRGMLKDGITAYEYAAKRLPFNHSFRLKIEQIEKQMESK